MSNFNYRAIDEDSRIIKGSITAADEDEVGEMLGSKGLTLIEASKARFSLISRNKLKEKDLLNFTYLLNLILTSGMSIMGGLSDMSKQSSNKNISSAASLLQAKLESGKSISESMLEYPELFPSFYTSMVRAGEVSGNLESVLNDIMIYLEWQMKFKKDIKAALSYPIIVLTAVAGLITILFTFVMPKFMTILTQLHVNLPLPTRILAGLVGFIQGFWPLIILFLIALPFIYRFIYSTTAGRRYIDNAELKIPLLGELVRKLNHSRYFRTFATLYKAGLNMNETLMVSASVVKNVIIAESFNRVTNSVLGGEQLSRALRTSGDFGPLLLNMIEIGEKTGTLDTTVVRISDIYDREIPETLKKVFMIIEPLLIVILGGIVLLTIASFFLPLYKIVGGIHGR